MRYMFVVLTYHDVETIDPEREIKPGANEYKIAITANTEFEARRKVLEQAWQMGLLVDRFLSVNQRKFL